LLSVRVIDPSQAKLTAKATQALPNTSSLLSPPRFFVRKKRAPQSAPLETLRTLDAIIHLLTIGSKGNRSRTCHNLHSKGSRNPRNSKWFLRPSLLPSSLITFIPLNPEATHFLTHRRTKFPSIGSAGASPSLISAD
jgi:hypothetical protein